MANFTQEKIDAAWNKAKIVEGQNPDKYRQDSAGAWMQRDKYGKEENFGWEVDHMFPKSLGGDENVSNIQALQWQNNRMKADNFPRYTTSISANGNQYIEKEENWKFNESFIETLKRLYPNNPSLNKLQAA